ncbi:putative membrane protein YsxD [Lentibacillus sp. JNUCC-1]|uniref:LiaI-LiaF-like domain-containing protein n=1 Tax=Lentibacillus sp. JNUCC-1 TaxID=2654513 RepID=UPI0012E78C1F|nr:DUF5668 domain-containing protein [Lentibacillus sp. JNUCC-1]MUV39412.1 putative membrane protein YsxD [Lentibacillus sp. JNUCC-1]
MKKQHTFTAYLLIGLGIYFLLKQLKVPILTDFYSWPTLLIIIGLAFLIYAIRAKEYQQLFTGTLLLGLGIHFHGLNHYSFWPDHWAMYTLIIGIAFFVRYLKTKQGMVLALVMMGLSLFFIFSMQIPSELSWIYDIVGLIERFWPVALVIIGLYLLKRK